MSVSAAGNQYALGHKLAVSNIASQHQVLRKAPMSHGVSEAAGTENDKMATPDHRRTSQYSAKTKQAFDQQLKNEGNPDPRDGRKPHTHHGVADGNQRIGGGSQSDLSTPDYQRPSTLPNRVASQPQNNEPRGRATLARTK
jgi:hypothetical protein